MKMTPFMQKAQKNMEPGVIIKTGFLGDDTRSPADIIQHDEEVMNSLGMDFETMVSKMKYLMEEGKKGLGDPITVDKTWRVVIHEARGKLPSPFEDGLFRKINATVTRVDNGRSISFSELSLFLIERHHFFQGKGSSYRVEPKDIKDVLGL